jgi:hypothetical protein
MGHRPIAWMRRITWLASAGAAVALAVPAMASATTRFAAPGGSAPDTACLSDTGPMCSIGTAAGGPDVTGADEAVILPGHYSEADLDGDVDQPSDHSVRITAGNVHGETGDRPVITRAGDTGGFVAFTVGTGTTLSDVEVDATDRSGISEVGGVVQRVIVRTSTDGTVPCSVSPGSTALLRDSVCFSVGHDSSAIRGAFFNNPGPHTVRLRNVTAIDTQPDSDALFVEARGAGVNVDVDAKGLIARGNAVDVLAEAFSAFDPPQPNTGANVSIALDHSNYVTWSARSDAGGGVAAVTPAGTGTNQTGTIVLAPDAYHQPADSGDPTIDHGAVDAFSGTTDIDGQSRTIGQAPDIGADELGFPTNTSLSCMPNPLQFGSSGTRCAVTVSDTTSPPPVSFGSGIRLTSDGSGMFGSDCEVLDMTSPTQGMCANFFTPAAAGVQRVTATYPGDSVHDPSQATDLVNAMSPPAAAPPAAKPKRCKHHKHHKHHGKKRKCRRKPRM